MTELDLNDPLVRDMAEWNHRPHEQWNLGGDVLVLCETCAQEWPCSVRRALRRREEGSAEPDPNDWRCRHCGSHRWVGWRAGPAHEGSPRRAQCLPCGYVQSPPAGSEAQ